MTQSDAQRAYLVEFCCRQVGENASLEAVLAIAYVIRNRVRAGWEGGNWIKVMERAHLHAAHEPGPRVELDAESRVFQMMLRRVDDIYFAQNAGDWGDVGGQAEGGLSMEDSLTERNHERLYWYWINRPVRPWFQENILADKKNHKRMTQLGLMIFVE